MIPDCYTLDFESMPAEGRPNYPPKPVGLAGRHPSGDAGYAAFGHITGGNSATFEETQAMLSEAWNSGLPILFFNAKFDLAIAYEIYGMPVLPWDRVHDAMFLAYLCDPHSRDLSLKGLCTDLLGWDTEERDAMGDWLWQHRRRLLEECGVKITRGSNGVANAAKWTAYVPGDVAAPYAVGDVERTWALFSHLYPIVVENGMLASYDRERQLLPILMENEVGGMRVDLNGLRRDVSTYSASLELSDNWLRKRLNAPSLNLDADREVAAAFAREQIVLDEDWTLTPSGEYSVSKKVLKPSMFQDPMVASVYGYRNRLVTCLKMFMRPWLEQAEINGGFISTNWNQTRGGDGGTRTGRPSTSRPNFLNISKTWEGRGDGYIHPEGLGLPNLPLVRKYVLADNDFSLFLHRDFDGQELRVFAHFEDGDLAAKYLADATLDPHKYIQAILLSMAGTPALKEMFENRTYVKNMNFQSLYGGGVPALMDAIECSMAEAKTFKKMHDQALPGRVALVEAIRKVVRTGEPIVTWGGRLYFPEPPRMIKGRMRDFEYKLINYLIQGSAADITKQTIIDWHTHPKRDSRFLVTVYDEINISARKDVATEQMALLKEVMEANRIDVPMTSSGKIGPSWGQMEKCA